MKTVGFIDYFLNEWHANEYPAMIKAYNEKNGTDYQVKYAWAEMDIPGGMSTDEWCALHGVIRCNSIKELCAKCDCVFVLAPSNPEKHLEYAKVVDGQITAWDTVAGKTAIFDPNALWEPGRVEVVYLKVSNLGSLALKYQLGVNVVEEITGYAIPKLLEETK